MLKQEELNGMLQAQTTFDNQFSNNEIFKPIDTTALSEREVVQAILLKINKTDA